MGFPDGTREKKKRGNAAAAAAFRTLMDGINLAFSRGEMLIPGASGQGLPPPLLLLSRRFMTFESHPGVNNVGSPVYVCTCA